MKKKILLYALIGAPVGVTVGTVITILISLTAGDGNFYPVVPSLIEKCGNELNAVIVQTVCLLIYGAVWAAASLIWRMDEWSITRQTITHLIYRNDGTQYAKWTVVIYGDANGDGKIDNSDRVKIRNHVLGTSKLSGALAVAADVNKDGQVNNTDRVKVRNHVLGTSLITQ